MLETDFMQTYINTKACEHTQAHEHMLFYYLEQQKSREYTFTWNMMESLDSEKQFQ